VSLVVITLGFLLALGVLNLDTVLKSILAGAGVAGLAIGLALQGTLSNTFSGVLLAIKEVINIGDWVESNGFAGKVEKIELRNTWIREADNNIVVIPNKDVLEKPFKNYGLTSRIRVILHCGVGYSEDLERVRRIAKEAVVQRFPQDDDNEVEFYYEEFGASSINFLLRFWVDATEKLTILEARSEGIITVKKAFDDNNINIPFPIRTLEVSESSAHLARELNRVL
jgi:small conductance mechanosensitive channel